ncbi:MAG TPA: hypothetical protein VKE41_08575 [Roseiflexaceae bacterium]|nr:hypothetical protein [Roseiflexaceae bacterium]
MLRRIAILSLLLATVACGAGGWLAIRGLTGAFIAPGAASVRVAETGPGEREITYVMPNPDDGWQTAIARRLSLSGWRLDSDRWQWGGTETINVLATYVRTSRFWFFTVQERAELLGDRSSALIRVRYSFTTQQQQ